MQQPQQPSPVTNRNCPQIKPKWQIRIENKIGKLRKDIGRVTQYINGNHLKNILKNTQDIIANNKETAIVALDTLKQKLAVQTTRLRRYKESNERKAQNALFKRNENYTKE